MFYSRFRPVLQRFAPAIREVGARELAKPNPIVAGQLRGYPGYKNFGHKREIESLITKITLSIFGVIMIGTLFDWRWVRMIYLHYTGQLKEKQENFSENPVVEQSK